MTTQEIAARRAAISRRCTDLRQVIDAAEAVAFAVTRPASAEIAQLEAEDRMLRVDEERAWAAEMAASAASADELAAWAAGLSPEQRDRLRSAAGALLEVTPHGN